MLIYPLRKKLVFSLCMCLYDGGQRVGEQRVMHMDVRKQFCVVHFLLLPLCGSGYWTWISRLTQ